MATDAAAWLGPEWATDEDYFAPACFVCGEPIRNSQWFLVDRNRHSPPPLSPNVTLRPAHVQYTYYYHGVLHGLACTRCGGRATRLADMQRGTSRQR